MLCLLLSCFLEGNYKWVKVRPSPKEILYQLFQLQHVLINSRQAVEREVRLNLLTKDMYICRTEFKFFVN